MDQNQPNSQPAEEDETGLAGLVVPAQADNLKPINSVEDYRPEVIDPLAADRANRVAAIRAEAAAREAELIAQGKTVRELPEVSATLLARAEEHAAAEARAASPFKVSSNPNEVLPTREELLARNKAFAEAQAEVQASNPGPVDVQTDTRYAGMTWEQVVATRQEEARIRRHQKDINEKESNQAAKEAFKARILAARQPEVTVHRPQPTAPAISAQTRAEMEAGRKRSEEFSHTAHVPIMPRVQ